jgi:DNA repair protein RadC
MRSYQKLVVSLCPPVIREGKVAPCHNVNDILALCGDLAQADLETAVIVTVDTRNRVINQHVFAIGTLNACLVGVREFFRRAILDNAASCVFVHNHPSGDTTPSTEDCRITRQLVEAGKLLGIQVLDSVIIGKGEDGNAVAYGFRESGIVNFGI